ncbi:hypothetical protein [Hymenobacter negativus]|uniref:Uncharacterized protein n=1 Tax=Hymenobacter negativus TaxID=2795026 RepID=A0ABS3QG16_9BACT|nr:hypothetical protein [Hymenobacter negativus]MBO2010196.1 hypothetical protein [Hymenobacter negativus]
MATPPLAPATSRLVGLLLICSGFLLGLGLLLKVGVSVYGWYVGGVDTASVALLSVNLLGLLASGLLMRWGLQMRRGDRATRNPDRNEML